MPVARDHPTWTSWMSMFLLEMCFTGIFSVIWKPTSPSAWGLSESSRYREVFVLPYLHLKASFALIYAVGGLASRPQVGKTLHRQRGGTVTIPGHLKMQVAVVYSKDNPRKNESVELFGWFLQPFAIQKLAYMRPGKLLCHQCPHLLPPAAEQDS